MRGDKLGVSLIWLGALVTAASSAFFSAQLVNMPGVVGLQGLGVELGAGGVEEGTAAVEEGVPGVVVASWGCTGLSGDRGMIPLQKTFFPKKCFHVQLLNQGVTHCVLYVFNSNHSMWVNIDFIHAMCWKS